MLPHEKRVLEERNQLKARLDALTKFLDEGVDDVHLGGRDLDLLREQEIHMTSYLSILNERIGRFVGVEK